LADYIQLKGVEGVQPAADVPQDTETQEALQLADSVIRNHVTGRCEVDARDLKICAALVKLGKDLKIHTVTIPATPPSAPDKMVGQWVRAEEAPKHWEGMEAWVYYPFSKNMAVEVIAKGYSRKPEHCGDIMFMLYNRPTPPLDAHIAGQQKDQCDE